jgi:hypothetical protein
MFALGHRRRRLAGAALLLAIMIAFPVGTRAQTAPTTPAPAFSGSAAAVGVRVTVNIPGAPLTDIPFDGGGPTAQVAADSIGASTGYAAFPDPGQFVLTVPGLAVGILASGAAGLPPVKIPSLPNYPFSVATDASGAPEASAGNGPYQISASSQTAQSKAAATAGLNTGLTGNAAMLTSNASLTPTTGGGVVAKAVSDLQGLSIGPLTLGEVKSTATETIDSTGTITPSSSLEISGLRIGGVPIGITPQGLSAGGVTVPLPINSTLNSLLKASGIKMELLPAQQFPGKVLAPALQVTVPFAMPFAIPQVGKFSGTVTMIVGSTTAQMSGSAADSGSGSGGTAGSSGSVGSSGSGDSGSVAAPPASGSPADTSGAPGAASPSSGSPGGLSGGGSTPTASSPLLASPSGSKPSRLASGPVGRRAGFGSTHPLDVSSLYFVVVVGVIVAVASGQLIRRLGVRS